MANSSILDSTATFERQARNSKLHEDWITALKASGIDTLSKLGYAVTNPGTAVTDEALQAFTNVIRPGNPPNIATNAVLKKLIFESQTFIVAALKATVQSTDTDVPKKLAAPERTVRLQKLKTDYPGLDIEGPLEPAHSLYDLVMNIYENEEIRYIAPSRCLSRQQELAGIKPEKEFQLDAAKGSLVFKEVANTKEIQISSDLALFQAMTRRALAFELIGLASFSVVQKWHSRMFALMEQAPAPGFQRVSQAQVLRADRQSFIRLGELANGSLKASPAGVKPLDDFYKTLYNDISVTYFLPPVSADKREKGDKAAGVGQHTQKNTADHKQSSSSSPPIKTKTKQAKGRGKGKARDPMPQALRGMDSRTKDGKAICFSYNLGRCQQGDKCSREHVCCVPGCGEKHPQTEHS